MTKISVIVPVYNVEKYLETCIYSIINQTYKDLEIIIVDDGSTDGSGIICDKIQKLDERIIIIHKENGGLSSARNAGLDIAKGEYVAFVDSDDYIHPNYIELLHRYCEKYKSDISVCDYISVNKNIVPLNVNNVEKLRVIDANQAISMLSKNEYLFLIVCWNKLYKKSLFDDIRFPNGKIHEDEFVTHQLLYNANKIVISNQYLYYYRRSKNSITGQNYSEKQFDGIEGMLSRAVFLKKHGFNEELNNTLKRIKGLINKADNYCKERNDNELYKMVENYVNQFCSLGVIDNKKNEPKEIKYMIEDDILKSKIVIYGAGDIGKKIYNDIDKANLVGWVDNRWFYLNNLDCEIKPINEIINMKFDYVVLTQKSTAEKERVRNQLVSWGIQFDKICFAREI